MESYSLPARQPVGPGAAPDNLAVRGGVQGGVQPGLTGGFTPTAPTAANSTLDSIARFAGNLMAPAIQREREARFLQGASRVAQGEAAADIDAQRPAWARAFGDTDEVLGARAYEGKADAARAELALRDTMDQDAELDPDTYAQTIQKRLKELDTGDAQRDTVWRAQVMGTLPMLMKEHAKAHKAWNQKRALVARDDAIGAHLTAFETAARQAGQAWSVDDRTQFAQRLLADIAPVVPGENPEVRDAQLARHLEAQVARGNFAAITLFRDNPELWGSLPTGVQDRLEQLTRTRASQEIGKAIGDHPDMWEKMDLIYSDPPDTVEELLKQVDAFNDELQIRTGIPADLITQNDVMRIWQQQKVRDRQEAARVRAAVQGRMGGGRGRRLGVDSEIKAQAATRYFEFPGGPERARDRGDVTAKDLALAGDQLFGKAQTPEEAATLLLNADSVKIPAAEQQATAISRATQWGPEFDSHAKIVAAMGFERAGKLGYWSAEALDIMEKYLSLSSQADLRGNPTHTPQLAFQEARARVLTAPLRASATKGRSEAVTKLVDSTIKSWADPWFGPDQATKQGMGVLRALVFQEIDKSPVGLSDQVAVAAAWGKVRSSAKSIGQHFYVDKSESRQDPLSLLNRDERGVPQGIRASLAQPAFDAALSKKLGREAKLNEADFLIRIPAQDGDFAFLTTAMNKDGVLIPVVIRAQDVERELKGAPEQRITRQPPAEAIMSGEVPMFP